MYKITIKKGMLSVSAVIPYIAALLIVVGVVFWPVRILTFAILSLYIMVEKNIDDIFAVFFFICSYASAFKLSADSTALSTYLQCIFMLKLFLKNRFEKKYFVCLLLYIIYLFIGMGNAYVDVVKQMMFPVLIYFCMQDDVLQNTYKYMKMFSMGVLSSSVVSLFRDSIPNLSSLVNEKSLRLEYEVYTNRFSGLLGDPNYYSINLMLVFVFAIILYVRKKTNPIMAFSICGLVIVFGAMTNSKSFLLMLAAMLIIVLVELIKNKKYFVATVAIVAIVVAVTMIMNGKIEMFDIIFKRISKATTIAELTTERSDIWNMYISNFRDRPIKTLFGNGWGIGYSYERYPHNTYIDCIDILGVIGTGLFFCTILFSCRTKRKSYSFLDYLPLIVVLVMYFSLSMLHFYMLIYHLMLVIMIIYFPDEQIRDHS